MYKWIQNRIRNFETLTHIEGEILLVKKSLRAIADTRIRTGIDTTERVISFMHGDERKEYDRETNELQATLEQLETKRQHKLDRRNGWRSKFVWSVVAPILVTVMTTYLLVSFNLIK